MKHFFTLAFFVFLGSSAAFGQNTSKLLIAQSQFSLDVGTGEAQLGDSLTFAYNNQLQTNLIKHFNFFGAGGSLELESRQTNYSYDANGNLLYFNIQLGNDVAGWTDDSRYTYTYDANGHPLTFLLEEWTGTDWATLSSTTYVYDVNGNILSETSLSSRNLYTYNAQNLLETKTWQLFGASDWEDYEQLIYTYVPSTSLVETETDYYWEVNAWKVSSRNTNNYDVKGDKVQTLSEWNDNGDWQKSGLVFNTYNANHDLSYWLWQSWEDTIWVNTIQQFNTFDNESNFLTSRLEFWQEPGWAVGQLGHLYYAEFVATHSPQMLEFGVYPNPASAQLTLQSEGFSQAQILDTQGRTMRRYSLQGQSEETIQLGNLPAGNYLLQVFGKDGKMAVKPIQVGN